MPNVCVFIVCGSTKTQSSLCFFKFPTDSNRRQEWYRRCSISLDLLPKHPILCEKHFDVDDFSGATGRRRLKPNALPGSCNKNCTVNSTERTPLSDISNRINQTPTTSSTDSSSMSQPLLDHEYCLTQKSTDSNWIASVPTPLADENVSSPESGVTPSRSKLTNQHMHRSNRHVRNTEKP